MIKLKKLHAKEIIKKILGYQDYDTWLCIGEIATQARGMGYYIGTSDNSVGTRLPEMERAGLVKSRTRENCNYKEWVIIEQLGNNGEEIKNLSEDDPREER